MSALYNINGKRLNINDFQHPNDKRAVETVLHLPGFEKIMTFLSEHSIEKYMQIIYDASELKITKEMSPKIFGMINEAAEMYGVDIEPRLYLSRAYTMMVILEGIKDPFIILTTSFLENLSDERLWALLSSEIAGIQAHHGMIKFVDTIIHSFKGLLPFGVDVAVDLAMKDWYRNKGYTYDRAILLATENFDEAMRIILMGEAPQKVLDGIAFSQPNNPYYEQAKEFLNRGGINAGIQKLVTIDSKDHWYASRYMELYNWYTSGEYDEVLERSMER